MTGANGYVGNYIIKTMAKSHPEIQMVGMSRRGKQREGEKKILPNISYFAGNCLNQSSFENELADVDAVVHCVGALFDFKKETGYNALNRDSCINMAKVLQQYAKESNAKRNFVMISSSKAPFFARRYLTTK